MARNYIQTHEEKRREFLKRNMSINMVHEDLRKKNAKPEPSQDTLTRKEIQKLIEYMISEGKNEEEITAELSNNPNYSKYSIYFKSWIDNKMKKADNELER